MIVTQPAMLLRSRPLAANAFGVRGCYLCARCVQSVPRCCGNRLLRSAPWCATLSLFHECTSHHYVCRISSVKLRSVVAHILSSIEFFGRRFTCTVAGHRSHFDAAVFANYGAAVLLDEPVYANGAHMELDSHGTHEARSQGPPPRTSGHRNSRPASVRQVQCEGGMCCCTLTR